MSSMFNFKVVTFNNFCQTSRSKFVLRGHFEASFESSILHAKCFSPWLRIIWYFEASFDSPMPLVPLE